MIRSQGKKAAQGNIGAQQLSVPGTRLWTQSTWYQVPGYSEYQVRYDMNCMTSTVLYVEIYRYAASSS